MINTSNTYTLPVLKMGKPVRSVPKGSTKKIEQAKQTWYIEYYFENPETGLKERIRETRNLNRIKDPIQKEASFKAVLDELNEFLLSGYSPFSDNKDLKNSMIAHNLKDTVKEFLDYHVAKKSRPDTLATLTTKTNTLLKYFGEDKKVKDISTTEITNMMLELEKKGNWSAKTFVNNRLSFTNFFNFARNTGKIHINPLENFREKRKVLKSEHHQLFTDEHFALICNYLKEKDPYTLFCLKAIYYTCLRPAELRLLQCKYIDISDPDNATIVVTSNISKNKKSETINIDSDLVAELQKLNLNNKYLLGNADTITSNYIQVENKIYYRFRRALKALNLSKFGYSIYSAKHLSNVRKFRSGFTLAEIMVLNRHSSLAQTETYLRHLMKDVQVKKKIPTM